MTIKQHKSTNNNFDYAGEYKENTKRRVIESEITSIRDPQFLIRRLSVFN